MKQQSGMRLGLGLGLGLLVLMVCLSRSAAEELSSECSKVVEKVIPCLNFATGKEATPKKDCCDAMGSMKETKPECLCYVIQETHKGSPQVKSLGIQEDKLLHLPSLCNLKNASVTNCPKLLGLSPNSPDAAIFTNSSKATPSSATPESSTPMSQNVSYGNMARPRSVTHVMMVALAIVVVAVPSGFVSIIYT